MGGWEPNVWCGFKTNHACDVEMLLKLPTMADIAPNFWASSLVWLLLPPVTGFCGYFAYQADPLLVGMAFLLVLGGGLMGKPVWILTILLVFGLLMTGPVNLFLESLSGKALWGSAILGLVLMFLALFKVLTHARVHQGTPKFVWLALLFIIYVLLESAFQLNTMKELIAGFKRYFQVWGVMFAFCWLGFSRNDINRWQWLFLLAALVQLPFCLYELIRLVPVRESMRNSIPDLVPIDIVAGTFAGVLSGGGGSSEMSTFLVIVFAFLLARYKEQQLASIDLLRLMILLFIPLLIGEAKIIVIFLPLACAIIYQRELIARPMYLLAALVLGAVFLAVMAAVMVSVTQQSLDQLVFETLQYNFYGTGYGGLHLNRTTVLTFWASQQSFEDPLLFSFGCGLGCVKVSLTPDMPNGFMSARYPNYGINLTSASTLLWEVGLVGVALLGWFFISAWRCAVQLAKFDNPQVRADAKAIQATIALFGLYLFYMDSVTELAGFQLILFCALGYLAWLYRQHGLNKPPITPTTL